MVYNIKVFKGSSTGEVHEGHTQRPEVTRDQVYLDITHSGVCGTDEHFKYVDMGLGHEGIGIVRAIGPDVKALKMYGLLFPSHSIHETNKNQWGPCRMGIRC